MIKAIPINTEGYQDAKVGDKYEHGFRYSGGLKKERWQVTEIRGGFIHLRLMSEKIYENETCFLELAKKENSKQ